MTIMDYDLLILWQLEGNICKMNISKHLLEGRVIKLWNSLPNELADCFNYSVFKSKLQKYLQSVAFSQFCVGSAIEGL